MNKSAFAELLDEAADLVRKHQRREIDLHFDWNGTTWCCWEGTSIVFKGSAGEEALRRFVEAIR